jgi:hypothetical protein
MTYSAANALIDLGLCFVFRIGPHKRACIDWSGQRPVGRPYGSYVETAFEVVIEPNRCGTWTINAVVGN